MQWKAIPFWNIPVFLWHHSTECNTHCFGVFSDICLLSFLQKTPIFCTWAVNYNLLKHFPIFALWPVADKNWWVGKLQEDQVFCPLRLAHFAVFFFGKNPKKKTLGNGNCSGAYFWGGQQLPCTSFHTRHQYRTKSPPDPQRWPCVSLVCRCPAWITGCETWW